MDWGDSYVGDRDKSGEREGGRVAAWHGVGYRGGIGTSKEAQVW